MLHLYLFCFPYNSTLHSLPEERYYELVEFHFRLLYRVALFFKQ